MNILFICSQNKWRSPTAEHIFADLPGINTRSAGTSKNAKIRIHKQDIHWSDIIFVMEKKHLEYLQRKFDQDIQNKTIKTLHIPDNYHYMDEELIEIIKQRVGPFLPT